MNNKLLNNIKTFEEYISTQPRMVSERLQTINKIIQKLAPKAVACISYGMPAYKLDGKVLIYFAAHKKHIGLYPYPSAIEAFRVVAQKYKTAKGSIQFQNEEKLPVGLITKIIKYRVGERTKRLCSRKHSFYGSGPCTVCWPGRLKNK